MTRGEVYWADLAPRSGSEQSGRRPVVILSHNAFNQSPGWNSIIVVPLSTSSSQAKRGPTIVVVPAGTYGLSKAGVVLCHQITTLDRSKLLERIGAISPTLLRSIENGVKAAIDLDL